MAYFRKSKKVGPFRINLSSSGIGVSAGVKGLRVGVSPKGQAYATASALGITHRHNFSAPKKGLKPPKKSPKELSKPVGKSSAKSESKRFNSMKIHANQLTDFGYEKGRLPWWLFAIPIPVLCLGVIHEVFVSLFVLSLLVIPVVLLVSWLLREGKYKEVVSYLRNLKQQIDERKFHDVEKLIAKISENFRDENRRQYLFGSAYAHLHPVVTEDLRIDAEEERLLLVLRKLIPMESIREIDAHFLLQYVQGIISDEFVDDDEKEFLRAYGQFFSVTQEAEDKIADIVSYFDRLNALRGGNPPLVEPTIKELDESDQCFLENEYEMINEKSGTVKEYGQLFLTKGTLQFVAKGHRKLKLRDILEVSNEGKLISVAIKNRKTPILIRSGENQYLYELLEYLRGQR